MGKHFTEDARDYLEPLDRLKLAVISDELTATMKEIFMPILDKLAELDAKLTADDAADAALLVERDQAVALVSTLTAERDQLKTDLKTKSDELTAAEAKVDELIAEHTSAPAEAETPVEPVVEPGETPVPPVEPVIDTAPTDPAEVPGVIY